MSQTMTIDQAAANLRDIVGALGPGDEVVLTRDDQPVAKIIGQPPRSVVSRQPGSCKGMLTIVSEDDEHLNDFKEYMP